MVASVFSQITVNSNYPSSQVVAESGIPVEVLLFNTDPQNTIWLADNNAVQAGDVNNATPLAPLSSVTFNGEMDVFAGCISGQTAKLNIYPSGSSYFQGSGIQPIALFPNPASLPFGGTVMPGPGSAVTIVNMADVSGFSSYDISSYAFTSGSVAASPLCMAYELTWFEDPTSQIPVYQENWWFMLGGAAPAAPPYPPYSNPVVMGTGPNHARYLTVRAWTPTLATVNANIQFFNLFGSFRTSGKSDWRHNSTATLPLFGGFNVLNNGLDGCGVDSVIANVDPSNIIAANKTQIVPFSLYNGEVFVRFELLNGTTATADPVIFRCDQITPAQLIPGTRNPGVVVNFQNTTAVEQELLTILPRVPCALIIQGNAAGTTNYALSVTAAQ